MDREYQLARLYRSPLDRHFDYSRIRQFKGWGAKREWPVLNVQAPSNPNHYIYISERFITRTIFR